MPIYLKENFVDNFRESHLGEKIIHKPRKPETPQQLIRQLYYDCQGDNSYMSDEFVSMCLTGMFSITEWPPGYEDFHDIVAGDSNEVLLLTDLKIGIISGTSKKAIVMHFEKFAENPNETRSYEISFKGTTPNINELPPNHGIVLNDAWIDNFKGFHAHKKEKSVIYPSDAKTSQEIMQKLYFAAQKDQLLNKHIKLIFKDIFKTTDFPIEHADLKKIALGRSSESLMLTDMRIDKYTGRNDETVILCFKKLGENTGEERNYEFSFQGNDLNIEDVTPGQEINYNSSPAPGSGP